MASYMIYGYGDGGDILIDNNTVTNTRVGIAVLGIPAATISNNKISQISWDGVQIDQKVVTINGISTTYFPDDCKVMNNCVSDFGKTVAYSSGVYLNNCQRTEVSLNVIDGNNNANAVYGIGESGTADYSVIDGNVISKVQHSIVTVGTHTTAKDNALQ